MRRKRKKKKKRSKKEEYEKAMQSITLKMVSKYFSLSLIISFMIVSVLTFFYYGNFLFNISHDISFSPRQYQIM